MKSGAKFINIWKIILKKKYFFISLAVALLFYFFHVFFSNLKNIFSFYSSNGFAETIIFSFALVKGFSSTIEFYEYIILIFISLLFGILCGLIFFKIDLRNQRRKVGVLEWLAVFFGVLAPGCVACGVGLVSALGIGGGIIYLLPYDGIELSFLAIALLSFSIFKTTKDLTRGNSCEIRLKSERRKNE